MSGRTCREVPCDRIICPKQIREVFDLGAAEMDRSVRRHGVVQPLLVEPEGPDGFRLIDGESRLRSARRVGLTNVPIIIETGVLDPSRMIERQLLLNSIRRGHLAIEKSRNVNRWIEELGGTPEQAAEALGVTESAITKLRVLSRLPKAVQALLEVEKLAAATAYELSRLDDPAAQEELASLAVEKGLGRDAVAKRVAAIKAGRRPRVPRAGGRPRAAGIEAVLSGGRRIVFAGAKLESVEELSAWIDELSGKVRKARGKFSLPTFLGALRDAAEGRAS